MKQTTPFNSPSIRLFLCGDVMTGRGIDQILPDSVDPILYESYVKDARQYGYLAEDKNGPIPYPVSYQYIWGDALEVWRKMSPVVKIINLETSLTVHDQPWIGKGINYRMHPNNIKAFTAAEIDCCSLANNHIMDWERDGLDETIKTLQGTDIIFTGAGKNKEEAETPAILPVDPHRIIVLSYGMESSGIPPSWSAQKQLSGINILPAKLSTAVDIIKKQVERIKQKNDIIVFSVHWGDNWGYKIPLEHSELAHKLIDLAGVDIIHGHSSHHPMGFEVYKGKLILYGTGDLINDYEGIIGYEDYRDELSLMYFPEVNPVNGELISMKMVPMEIKNFRLNHCSSSDALWLNEVLNREVKPFGIEVKCNPDNTMDIVMG